MKNISGKLLASGARLSVAALACSFASVAHAGIAAREYLDLSKWDVDDYVQEGLVLHYDGIRNVGADQPHSRDTTTWANLAPNTPNKDMEWSSRGYASLSASRGKNSEGEWSSNGFVFNGKACWIKWNDGGNNPVVVPSQYTMQFAMTANTADQAGDGETGYLLELNDGTYGWKNGSVAIRKTAHDSGYTTANAVYAVDEERLGSTSIRPYFNDATPSYATVLADASAVRVFSGTTLPEAGTSGCAAITGTSPLRSSTVIALGGLYNKIGSGYTTEQFQGFTGTLHNFRIYSKALSEDDLERNRIVDDARFFGKRHPIAVTNVVIASTYSFLDGTEPAGFYQIDGSHTFTAKKEVMTTNSFKYACTGYSLETWNYATESWGDPVMSNDVLSVTISASDRKRVTWLWKATRAKHTAADYTLADYSPAGLVLNYDGIHNDGADNPHSTTTQKWKNLAQGWEDQDMYAVNYSLDNNTGGYYSINVKNNNLEMNGEWNEKDNGYVFNGKECFMKWNEGRKFILPPAYTWQFAMDAKTANQRDSNGGISYLFLPHAGVKDHGSWPSGSVQMRAKASGEIPADSIVLTDETRYDGTDVRPYFSDSSPRFATVLADSKAARVFGGVEIPTSGPGYKEGAMATTRTNNWFVIGGQYNPISDNTLANFQGFRGTMHSVRFYDRPLTEEELKRNREADSARFFGELATTNVVEVIGDKETAYKVEGEWPFDAPETVTVDNVEKPVAGYRLAVWENGGWVRKPFCREKTFTYREDDAEIGGKTVKLTWEPEPAGLTIFIR